MLRVLSQDGDLLHPCVIGADLDDLGEVVEFDLEGPNADVSEQHQVVRLVGSRPNDLFQHLRDRLLVLRLGVSVYQAGAVELEDI